MGSRPAVVVQHLLGAPPDWFCHRQGTGGQGFDPAVGWGLGLLGRVQACRGGAAPRGVHQIDFAISEALLGTAAGFAKRIIGLESIMAAACGSLSSSWL